ncbi:RNA-binding family protein [Salix suchowensis]|nr:RNA-binding family protein [Salix suchowensis]
MAAALRRIAGEKSFMLSSISAKLVAAPSSLFIWQRGITTKLFVGGLSFYTTENGLSEAFSQHGQVVEAKIVMDRASDKSKGFGFVTYASEDEAQKALDEMNGKLKTNFGGGIPIARGPPEPTTPES